MGTITDADVGRLRRRSTAWCDPFLHAAFWLPRSRTSLSFTFISVLAFMSMLVLQVRHTFISEDNSLNVDEAELLAQGNLAASDITPSRNFSTSTFGPLVPMALGLLIRIGVEPSLSFAHTVSAVTVALISWLVFVALVAARCPPFISILGALPAAATLAVGGLPQSAPWDFASLSTSGISALVLALALPLGILGKQHSYLLLTAAFLCGLAPWVKFQSTPLAVVLLASFLLNSPRSGRPPRKSVVGLAFVTPSILLCSWMVMAGTLDTFFVDSITASASYVQRGGLNSQSSPFIRTATALMLLIAQPLLLTPLLSVLILVPRHTGNRLRLQMVAAGALIIGLATIALPGNAAGHYLYFWVIAVTIAAVLLIVGHVSRPFQPERIQLPRVSMIVLVSAATAILLAMVSGLPTYASPYSKPNQAISEAISEACPLGSRALIWGWAPELYAYYGWQSATRYPFLSTSMHTLESSRAASEFTEVRRVLLNGEVDCVVTALGPPFFTVAGSHGKTLTDVVPAAKDLTGKFRPITIDDSSLSVLVKVHGTP